MKKNVKINWPDGLDKARFLREYWQQKPLLIRQAFPDFVNPLSPDELGGLAMEESIHSRIILQQKAPNNEGHDIWHLRNGPFTEEELTELPTQDWSLLVSDIEKHLDGFHQYLEPYRFIPDWRIDDLMISYAPTGASVGAHIDAYDVFLLQASGRRQWSISTDPQADSSFIEGLDLKILAQFQATEVWELDPGDLLYLPPGLPHHGVSLDDECMTWSIGFRAPTHAALVSDIAEQLSQQTDARYEDGQLSPVEHLGEIDAHTLANIRQVWETATDADLPAFELAVGRVLTQRSETAEDALPMIAVEDFQQILQHQSITRSPASRLAYITAQTTQPEPTAILFVDGEHYSVSVTLARLLCADYSWAGNQLLERCRVETDRACLLTLWQLGVLYAAD